MRRKGDFSGDIARKENYYKAFDHASKNKHGKKAITKFEADLEKNLSDLLYSFENGTFVTSPYRFMTVHEPKKRLIGMLPFPDHVQHWAMLNEVEDYFTRSFSGVSVRDRIVTIEVRQASISTVVRMTTTERTAKAGTGRQKRQPA